MRLLLLALLALLPIKSLAQEVANLVADSVTIEGGDRLLAAGNVEVFFDDQSLSASQIVFDQSNDRLEIFGPLVIRTADGAILTADRASLDPRLENGLLRGARLVLEQQLQLAANQIDRVDGRYSQLYKSAVTSCRVCGTEAPLWSIRAERIIHDEQERQLYFENATFHVRDMPIFWIPRARFPDPTLTRATGFLVPSIRTTNQLNTGIKVPYFITLGDHRDLTVTPYLSLETRTLEARYRQAFVNGNIEVNAAVSRDTLESGSTRAYVFAEGNFELPNNFKLNFDIENSSDPAYLLDYGYSEKDRLDSAIEISRTRQDDFFRTSATYFETLRDDETNNTLPPIVGDFSYERRFADVRGGTLTWKFDADAIARGQDSTNFGRDVFRTGTELSWAHRWQSSQGLVANSQIGGRADYFRVISDANFENSVLRVTPAAAFSLRYPLSKRTEKARHLIEPVLALAWSNPSGDPVPNEDSTRPELDQGNLFLSNRLPGEDTIQSGLSGALGLTWTRLGSDGSASRLTFGRVFQDEVNDAFNEGSGLDSVASDWLVAGQIEFQQGLLLQGRALLSNTLDPTLATARMNWQNNSLDLVAQYIWQAADADLGTSAISEWSFDTSYQLSDVWKFQFSSRYDVVSDRPARAALGVEWRNECVTVDLSLSRRFTSSTTVDPSTDFGLSVSLNGFSAGRSISGPTTRCDNE